MDEKKYNSYEVFTFNVNNEISKNHNIIFRIEKYFSKKRYNKFIRDNKNIENYECGEIINSIDEMMEKDILLNIGIDCCKMRDIIFNSLIKRN